MTRPGILATARRSASASNRKPRVLSIRLLGSPKIFLDGAPLNLSRRKSRALVYYLAAHSAPVSREQLLSLFWPDLDRPAAQQTLRTTLHGLRQALGPAVQADDGSLS